MASKAAFENRLDVGLIIHLGRADLLRHVRENCQQTSHGNENKWRAAQHGMGLGKVGTREARAVQGGNVPDYSRTADRLRPSRPPLHVHISCPEGERPLQTPLSRWLGASRWTMPVHPAAKQPSAHMAKTGLTSIPPGGGDVHGEVAARRLDRKPAIVHNDSAGEREVVVSTIWPLVSPRRHLCMLSMTIVS
jgi:hypothetical protein